MSRHATPSGAAGQPPAVTLPQKSEPQPKSAPADIHIPNEVFDYIGTPLPPPTNPQKTTLNLTFTPSHALLVGLVGKHAAYKGIGCWMSNKHRAEKLHVTERRVQRLIADCLDLGFLIDQGEKLVRIGEVVVLRRVLQTAWTSPVQPRLKKRGGDINIRGGDINDASCLQRGGDINITHIEERLEEEENQDRKNTVAVRETRSGDDVLSDETPTLNTPTKARHAPAGDLKPPVNVATRPHRGQKPAQEGLFPVEGAEGQEGAVNDKFMRRAKRLRQIVVDKCGVFKPYTPSMWARDFRLLESDLSGDLARIDAALDWYAVHAGGDWVPEIESASTFRDKFTKLEKAIKRDQAQNPVPAVTAKTPLHKDTADVMREISGLHWPGDAPQRLPVAISKSLTARFAFQAALPNLELSKAADEIRKRILKHHVPIPHFIGNWMQDFHKKHAWKRDWDGDLKKAVWRADHEDFRKLVVGWLRDWSGFPMNSEAWAELITAYKQVRT